MRPVTSDEIAAFSSPYLVGGYKTDELRLDSAEIADGHIVGVYSVPEHFIPADGVFHFTLVLAFIAVARLAIVYAHVDNGLAAKRSEVLVRHLDLRCRQLVTQSSDITVSMALRSRRSVSAAQYYRGVIDICDGAFLGEGSFFFPLPDDA